LHGWHCVRCRTGGFINIRLGWHRLCLVTNQAVICDPECPKSAPLSTGNLVNRACEIHAVPVRTHPSSNRATHNVYFVPRFSAVFFLVRDFVLPILWLRKHTFQKYTIFAIYQSCSLTLAYLFHLHLFQFCSLGTLIRHCLLLFHEFPLIKTCFQDLYILLRLTLRSDS